MSDFRVGTSSIAITPNEPMWLAGFAVRKEPSKGKVNDLFAKAMAIEDSAGHRIVIVSVELIAVSRYVADRVWAAARKRHGLTQADVVLCATHTHYGPELRPDKVPFFHIPPEYAKKIQPFADSVVTTLIALIDKALANLRPANLSIARSSADFASNRRPGEDPTDHEVSILQATSPDGKPIAIVVGYACHNTCIDPADCLYCGDWSGFACEQLQTNFPGSVAMFIAGAGADQNAKPRGTMELSRKYGQQLANAVMDGLKSAKPITGQIKTAYTEVALEYQPLPSRESLQADQTSAEIGPRTKAQFLLEKINRGERFDPSYPCPIQSIRIGPDFLLITIGGEPVIDYAVNLKRELSRPGSPGRLVWIAGYANDMFGYVPTPRVLRAGGYEGGRSVLFSALPMPFTERVEERVMSGVRRLQET
jgi:hypothetical protein